MPPSTKNKDVIKSTQRNRFARSNKMDLMNSVRRGPETRKRREYKWGDEDDEDEFGSELRKAKNRMREPSNERLVCDASFVDTARDHDTDEKKAPMKQYVMQENQGFLSQQAANLLNNQFLTQNWLTSDKKRSQSNNDNSMLSINEFSEEPQK